jgi:hypothetical protein
VPQRQPPAIVPEVALDRVDSRRERALQMVQVVARAMRNRVVAATGRGQTFA